MFEKRNIQYLFPEDYDALSNAFLPNVVLQVRVDGHIAYLDFGTILYKKHTTVKGKTHSASVYKNTLFSQLIAPLHKYTLMLVKKYSHASIKHYFKVIRTVMKDLYSLYKNIELKEKSQTLEIYKNYTHHLIMSRSIKLKDSIADMGIYSRKQNVLAEILARSLDIDLQEVKDSYIELASKHKQHIEPVEAEKFSSFFELNKNIFLTFSNFILDEKSQFPVEIKFREYDIDMQFHHFHKADNKNKNRSRIKMINIACSAFVNCFVSATSMNSAQIYNLRIDDIKDLKSSTKGMRVITVKPRAKYKTVEFNIPLKFKNLINSFLLFRAWIYRNYKLEINSPKVKELLFFGLNNTKNIRSDNFIISYSDRQHQLYRQWFVKTFHSIKWIPLSKIRATVANIYNNESNNSLIVAKKLSNTPEIVTRSYSEATENQVLSEMTNIFSEITKASPFISTKIIHTESEKVNNLNTDMGHCIGQSPNLDSTYQSLDLDPPNCSNTISCLFCENYVVHADEEDIRKLLSAKKVFEMANTPLNVESIYTVLQKINEIFALIKVKHPDKENQILKISKEINQGKLTNFFGTMMNLLTDLGIDFYE